MKKNEMVIEPQLVIVPAPKTNDEKLKILEEKINAILVKVKSRKKKVS